jgi:hypothetical protein
MSGGLGPRTRGAERAPAHGAAMLQEDRSPPPAEGVRGMTPEKFTNFTCKILNFGAHLSKIINLLC